MPKWGHSQMLDQVEGTVASLLLPSQDHQCYILRVMTPSDTLIVLEQQKVMQHDHGASFVQRARRRRTVSHCMIDSRMSGVILCIL